MQTGLRRMLAPMLLIAQPALAGDASVAELRDELRLLRENYASRIAELERQIAGVEARAAAVAPPATAHRTAPARGNAFNPEISLTLQGAYRSMKNLAEREISGFAAAHGHDHEEGGEQRGFTLDHTELMLAANVDDRFRGVANLALIDDAVEVEEAWFQTLGLGHGLTVKGGRFLSAIGYANVQHPHAWDFADSSLMYRALFGEHGSYGQDGVQLSWVAPTELFIELGGEIGRGAGFPGTDRNGNGIGATTVFAHAGGDVGAASSWRAGLSWLGTRAAARESHYEDSLAGEEVVGAFSGRSRTWIADAVWKWAPDGNPAARNLTLQAEYFMRRESGDLACYEDPDEASGTTACASQVDSRYRSRQSGWYAQAVYQFMPGWRIGARYDRLDSGSVDLGTNAANIEQADYRPTRSTLMVDWSPSEFSRIRLQAARDRSMQGVTDNQLWLQYVMSLGAHGAHAF